MQPLTTAAYTRVLHEIRLGNRKRNFTFKWTLKVNDVIITELYKHQAKTRVYASYWYFM